MRVALAAGGHVVEARGDVLVVVEAEHLGLGELLGELGAVPLGQAPDGGDLGTGVSGREQLVDGLLLSRLNEAARVDQDDVRVFPSPRSVQPPAARRAASSSESTSLRAQPSVTRLTVRELDTTEGT